MHVTIKYDPTWSALDWAKKHCRSYITNALAQNKNGKIDYFKIDYFFSDEKDAVLFILRWS